MVLPIPDARSCKNRVTVRSWLWTLLTIDAAFVVLSLLRHSAGPVASPMFALTEDGGFPEFFQYAKWAGIAAFMFAIAHIRRSRGFRVWGLFAVFLLVDDAATLHERGGDLMRAWQPFNPPFGLRLDDVGELAVAAVAGLFFLGLLLREYRRSDETFRLATQDFAVLVAVLAVVGVGIDMLHVMWSPEGRMNLALTVVEDGGEMIVASVMCWYAGTIARSVSAGARRARVIRLRPAIEEAIGKAA